MRLFFILFCILTCVNTGYAQSIDLSKPHETWQSAGSGPVAHAHLKNSGQNHKSQLISEGPFISYQVNVNESGFDLTNDAGNEPSIAVNPLNPKQIVIGWRQFDNINSDFRQAGLAWSNDGGLTWNNNGPLEAGVFRSDPVLAADADGTFFYQSLAVRDTNGMPGIQSDDTFSVDQWRSTDGGQNWFDKTNAIGGDKSWYAIDHSNTENRGNIYAAWNLAGNNHYPNSFNYSVDNGQSFSAPEVLPNSPIFGTVAVGFDGEVYVAGVNGETSLNDIQLITTNNPISAMFPDFGPVPAFLNLGGTLGIGGVNPVGLLGQVWVATDRSERHTRGRIYLAASVDQFGTDPLDVTFIRSVNGGQTFSTPMKINEDNSDLNWQWFGTMGVAPNGRIDVVWLDTRNHGSSLSAKTRSQLFYSYSYDGGVSFSDNQAVSADFDHTLGYPVQQKMGDYIDIVSANSGAHVAYTATFSGGQDVYYIHIKPSAVEENPYFPSHQMDGIWHNPDIPRQGIISKTLVQNPSSEQAQVINFEAVFTEEPGGQPTWFVLQTDHPLSGDEISYMVLFPTGDLAVDGTPLRPIGMVTKSRLYDSNNELLRNRVRYAFDMTDSVIDQLSELAVFDQDFFTGNPFYGQSLVIELQPVIATEQSREVHCLMQNLVTENPLERNEGRVPVIYQQQGEAHMFVADFTYQKTTEADGSQTLILDDEGLAIPTWETSNTLSGDWLKGDVMINGIGRPNGGNGFFRVNDTDPGLTQIATENLQVTAQYQLTSERDNGASEVLNAVALNSYCGTDMNL
ncbi:hypothetical protein ACFODZ_11705 [Marinicella sediminis]|uniref:Exo-alpha-sialidase n=1 Tax=Marinicella sediminis TaxID=1792834 RepID=A0ABV7JDF8_9GAMM|nr:sialidase family protein [Marinicella sediminis]